VQQQRGCCRRELGCTCERRRARRPGPSAAQRVARRKAAAVVAGGRAFGGRSQATQHAVRVTEGWEQALPPTPRTAPPPQAQRCTPPRPRLRQPPPAARRLRAQPRPPPSRPHDAAHAEPRREARARLRQTAASGSPPRRVKRVDLPSLPLRRLLQPLLLVAAALPPVQPSLPRSAHSRRASPSSRFQHELGRRRSFCPYADAGRGSEEG
jgi:hypothetical protein